MSLLPACGERVRGRGRRLFRSRAVAAPHPAVGHLLPANGEKKTHAAFFANPTMSGVGAGSFCGTAQAAFAASPTISLMIAFKSKFFGV